MDDAEKMIATLTTPEQQTICRRVLIRLDEIPFRAYDRA